jgi:PKD repeat protein
MTRGPLNRLCAIVVVLAMVLGTFVNVVAVTTGPSEVKAPKDDVSSRSSSRTDGPDPALFKNPPKEDRVLPIISQKIDAAAIAQFDSDGIGGMVVNSWNWNDTKFQDAKSRNWTMWVNDYYMYPSGSANKFGGVQETLWNPSFELAGLGMMPDGWQWTYVDWPKYDITSAKSHSGQAALAMDNMNRFMWVLKVEPGYEYNISVWARGDIGTETGGIIVIWANVDDTLGMNVTTFATPATYGHYSMNARAPPGANVARIILSSTVRNQYVWFDDCLVRRNMPVVNAAMNPSFETDTTPADGVPDNWLPFNGPTYDTTGSGSYTGSDSVKVNASAIFAQGHVVTEGKEYYFGEWIFSDTGPALGQLAILWLHDGTVLSAGQTIFVVNDLYNYYDYIFTAPATANVALVIAASASNTKVFVDDVVFYECPPLNNGVSRGPILDGHPELEAQGLYYASEDVTSLAASNLTVPPGKIVYAVGAPLTGNVLDLSKAVNLTSLVANGKLKYKPSGGMWRVMVFSCDALFNGTEVDRAITNMHQINVMNKVAVARFIEEMYNKTIYQKTSQYWGNMMVASFTDEVSNLAGYFIAQQYPVEAWLQDDVNKLYLTSTFSELHGYDLIPYLPALWNDVGPKTAKYRIDFYNTTAYLQGQTYYKMIGDWCADHGLNFSGHLLTEDSLVTQTAFYGDYFESAKYMGYQGIDALIRTGSTTGTDVITPKMASSTAVLYDKPHTMSEYSVAANSWNYREMTAVANWEMVQGIDRILSFSFPLGLVSDADLKKHSEQVGRSCYMLQQGNYTSKIAVLYPITGIQSDYIPLNTTTWNSWKFGGYEHDVSFQALTQALLSKQLDFIYINDENMGLVSVDNSSGKALMHHPVSGIDFQVMIVPEMNAIRTETLETIKKFYDAGGIVVAQGDLPTASAENGTDPYIDQLLGSIFNMSTIGSAGFAKSTNANGGISLRGANNLSKLEPQLRLAMKEDLIFGDSGHNSIYYMKRTDPTYDVYMLVNNQPADKTTDVLFDTLGDPSLWDPETGNVQSVSGSYYSYDPATKYTKVQSLTVKGWSSVFVVFKKPVLSVGPKDLVLDPPVVDLGKTIKVGLNVSNSGSGLAPQVNVKIYSDDPTLGGKQIGSTDTVTIAPGTSQHFDVTWDTKASAGFHNVTAVVCLPDGLCIRTQAQAFVNTLPVVRIEANRTQVQTYEEINFSSNSSDIDGPLTNISWDLGDGTTAFSKNLSHYYTNNGTYTVKLKVTDSNGANNTTSIQVTVLDRPPVASFVVSPGTTGNYTTEFKFNASGSSDRDGKIASYTWDFGDGSKVLYQGMTINYTFDRPRNYTVVLTTLDDDNNRANASMNITIINLVPVANFTVKPTTGNVFTNFKFNSTSKDMDGTIVAYNWSFGDGTYSNISAPWHKYLDDITYHVTLRVQDNLGMWSANLTKDIVILNSGPRPEVAESPGPYPGPKYVNDQWNFTANYTTDPDDNISELTFEWNFGDGSPNVTGRYVSHVYTKDGYFNATMKATDDNGYSATRGFNVKVLPRPVIPKPKPKPHDNGNAAAGIAAVLIIILAVCGIGGFLFMRKNKSKPEEKKEAPEKKDDEEQDTDMDEKEAEK